MSTALPGVTSQVDDSAVTVIAHRELALHDGRVSE